MNRGGYTCGIDIDLSEDVHPNFVRMGRRVKIRAGTIIFGSQDRELEIGDDVFIGFSCILQGGAEKISIGHRVTLAYGVKVHSDSGPNTSFLLQSAFPITARPVVIEDDTWIGDNVVILPGVTIGHGSVIGAQTLVKSNIEPHTVVGGNPQRVLRRLDDHKKQCHVCSLY